MDRLDSLNAVRNFALKQPASLGRDSYFGKCNVIAGTLLYQNVSVSISYNIEFGEYKVAILWEEDTSQPYYKSIGLYGSYSSNYQSFKFDEESNALTFIDDPYSISIHPCK